VGGDHEFRPSHFAGGQRCSVGCRPNSHRKCIEFLDEPLKIAIPSRMAPLKYITPAQVRTIIRISREDNYEELDGHRFEGCLVSVREICESTTFPVPMRPSDKVVESLTPKQLQELIALMWLGRDEEETAEDWHRLFDSASDSTPDYPSTKIFLAEDLEAGLEKLALTDVWASFPRASGTRLET
jgi:hypothetical protein